MELELFKKRVESLFIKAYDGNLALINFIDDTKREINTLSSLPFGYSGLRVKKAMPYANGTRIATVDTREIHIGVMVSPAPLIIPERLWVTATAI